MKTLTYLSTLLVLIIQVTVSGQTQDNQTHVIRVDIMGAKEPVKMQYSNSNITLSETEYDQLKNQAQDLKLSAEKMRHDALLMEEQFFLKQIEASQLSAKISLHKFQENKKTILNLFSKVPSTPSIYQNANTFHAKSEHLMKIALEMREEAAAQFSLQAKLGSMTNAEENEMLALNKQQEALTILQNALLLKSPMQNELSNTEKVMVNTNSVNANQLMELFVEATHQANNMLVTAKQLRETAKSALGNERDVLIKEALILENDFVSKRIEVSNLNAKLTYEKIAKNKLMINDMLIEIKNNDKLIDEVALLNIESDRLLKIGKEMREEGNAQLTTAAKHGALSNAEELESLALNKQHESIETIKKINPQMVIVSR